MTHHSHISRHRVSSGFVAVVALVAAAYVCRVVPTLVTLPSNVDIALTLTRDAILVGVPLGWVASVRRRVIHTQVRRYLTCAGLLMVFWMLLRTVKFRVRPGFEVESLLWYLYYLPILFIPTMCFFAFATMGKPEGFRLSRPFHLILAIPTTLLALTLTNNLTQWAFVFLTDPPSTANFLYVRSYGYYADVAWVVLAVCGCLALLVARARLLTARQAVAIMAVLALMAAYLLAYAAPASFAVLNHLVMRDVTATMCLFTMAVLELCLRFRIIQNNTDYDELFARIDTPVAILDDEARVCYASRQLPQATDVQLWQARSGPLELEGGLLVESMPIRGGTVVWTEDISQIRAMQAEIRAASEQLAGENDMLRAEVELKEKRAATEVRARLYDDVVREVSPELERLNALAENAGQTPEERTRTLERLCVIGAYVKRRSNLIFLAAQHDGLIDVAELYYCLRESADALKLMDVTCRICLEAQGVFAAEKVKAAYDFFERCIESRDPLPPTVEVAVRSCGDSLQVDVRGLQVDVEAPEVAP